MFNHLTIENLPNAVDRIYTKLESIEKMLKAQSSIEHEDPNKLLNIDEASDFLNLAKPTVYSMVSKGEIPYMKRSRRLYFSKIDLLQYVRQGRVKTNDEIKEYALNYVSQKKGA
ncbi:MAG: helix-turn-helix domain-containing protein [Crocinitomicaceae bacterium]|nr:helix-turn-helix domain-containing protein [Crocinitomicaceae bacterium]